MPHSAPSAPTAAPLWIAPGSSWPNCHNGPMVGAQLAASGATLLLEFGLLLLGLGVLARVAYRLGVSPIPLYLVTGLFCGEGGVVGIPAASGFVHAMAEVGVVTLLLLLGLEHSAKDLVSSARRTGRSAAIDVVANVTPGALVAVAMGWGLKGAVVLGGVTYISSSSVVSQLLPDLRWQANPETSSVVSLLIVEDLLMAPYLPVLAVLLAGASLLAGLIAVGVALAIVAVVITISYRGSRLVHRTLSPRDQVSLLLLVLGAATAAAGLANRLGFSAAVAAFLVGLLLTGEIAEVARRRLDPLRDVTAAVFFAYFGLVTNPAKIPSVLLPAAILAAATMATKALVAASLPGLSRRARARAAILLGARGEFSIVIAGIAAVAGVLPPSFEALAAAYVLLTAFAAPVLARVARGLLREPGPSPLGAT